MLFRFILFITLICVSPSIFAKKLYKYQDRQGLWHFTDQAPEIDDRVEIRQLKPAAKRMVWLEKKGDKTSQNYFILNHYPGPIEVEINWNLHDNVVAEPDLPHRFVVDHGESEILFNVKGLQKTSSEHYILEYKYVIGAPIEQYTNNFFYKPPIAPNSQFIITQGFGGKFSHSDEQNYYAIDIDMPIDTPIFAARGGVVLEMDDDYFGNGTEESYANKANKIRILHDDGSMAIYAHLATEKSLVSTGAIVKIGQLIGFSGNTGLTTGPHLHFAIQINRGMQLISTPFKFIDEKNISIEPVEGFLLKGYNTAPNNMMTKKNNP